MPVRFAIFASGSGSNAEALYQAVKQQELDGELVGIISDQPQAFILQRAQVWGVPTVAVSPKDFASKSDYEAHIITHLNDWDVEWIVLAGYMRLVGATLLQAFPDRIVNIHPSLLPAFPGKDAIGQALEHGVKVTGVTVHFVDSGMDTGPIIAQQAVPIETTREQTEMAIHAVEHTLYKAALHQLWNEERIK